MKDFADKIAVVTGGGTGMGRELARQLVAQGCHVAICDVSEPAMTETKRLCEADRPRPGVRITTHIADVSNEAQVLRFRDEVVAEHKSESIDLLFNNAGILGGNSFITDTRENWERTFNICWGGVYHCTRAFLPLLIRSTEARLVNTSSVSGLWAMLAPSVPSTAYSAAKFAVRGFTEALITDLRINAPHVECSVVIPGLIGTPLFTNTRRLQSGEQSGTLTPAEPASSRQTSERERRFIEEAPTSAAEAATIILDGVKAGRWRILVGADAERIDARVRATPEEAYDLPLFESLSKENGWQFGGKGSVQLPESRPISRNNK